MEDLVPGEVVERHRFAASERVARRHREHPGLADDDGPGDQIGLLDRQHQEQQVDLVGAEERQPVAQLVLADLHRRSRDTRLERVGDLQHEAAGGGAEEPDAEDTVHLAAGRGRPLDAGLDLLERGLQVIAEVAARPA